MSGPACKKLVLDAGPLLSLSPLRGLAETYLTVPQVLEELKDRRAREHFERLGLSAGVQIEIKSPGSASIAHVIQFAKKTGDYSVLSHADICILALTHELDTQEKEEAKKNAEKGKPGAENAPSSTAENVHEPTESAQPSSSTTDVTQQHVEQVADDLASTSLGSPELVIEEVLDEDSDSDDLPDEAIVDGHEAEMQAGGDENIEREPLDVELERVEDSTEPPVAPVSTTSPPTTAESQTASSSGPLYDDPSDDDDGEGEWITPSNVALHKSKHLDLLPSNTANSKGKQETVAVGCMTADFAMQNVLLQMGLSLVGTEGKRIQRLKTWVLRCHACFKICRDNSKQFCPSCGNPTLLRASVTVSAPSGPGAAPAMQVHLKKNFQYKLRGTIYSIPAPKPGSAKSGTGDGLVLREDQLEYVRAKKRTDAKRERDDRKLVSGVLARGAEGGVKVGSWMDPDWVPEMYAVGAGGKGRAAKGDGLPTIGYGRKNPNERRRKK